MALPADLDRRVRERAKGLCEYCKLPQSVYRLTFQMDHIIAEQHRAKLSLAISVWPARDAIKIKVRTYHE